jgi:glutamate-ammonia-ligase adenylyltransferase
MELETVNLYLDSPSECAGWLRDLRIQDVSRAQRNLQSLADCGISPDLMLVVCDQLSQHLPGLSDPDMALNNLDRFFAASRNPLALAALFERDPLSLPPLLQIFSTSQHLTDVLISDPASYDLLRMTDGQSVAREELVEEICSDVAAAVDERDVMAILRRHKLRETLRIAYGDIVHRQRVTTVTEQISFVADAICEAAVRSARQSLQEQRGTPQSPDGKPARFVVLALGKLGGSELNYSSDIDLIFLYEDVGYIDGPRSMTCREFFERLSRLIVKYLTENTQLGAAYRVDLRLRPDGSQGPPAIDVDAALRYYDICGRTWERQAFVKARPIAGDLDLGHEFLEQLKLWIYRRYLGWADIAGIRALKRRIEHRAQREGEDDLNVKTGHGGIRDIEFVIQFLQLLNGGDLPEVRTGNTLEAIDRLERAGCLTLQERTVLEDNYVFLRKLEHRLQIMFDLQTHTMPQNDEELRKLAIRMGFAEGPHRSPLQAFKSDYRQRAEKTRSILNYLLNEPFELDGQSEPEPEVDLVLDPDPAPQTVQDVLSPYGFRNIPDAYENLKALTTEKISFLSTRRCRHFLAAIARQLLEEIAKTPDPDATLVNLSKVSDSLGGKGVLWALFSLNTPSLKLYVRLCATMPYLAGILTSNPGMIDELMDSLVLDKLPSFELLNRHLDELLRGAEAVDPILHGFKNSLHLRVGVRDILGKEDIRNTHRVLSDISEVCLRKVADREFSRLSAKYGTPMIQEEDGEERPCELVILGMGKLGGREPNYHSDLDVMFLYEADGTTRQRLRSRSSHSTTNQHFFTQLGQRIIKTLSQIGPHGRLYEIDARLRPTGRSGALAVSLNEFVRYFAEGQGQLWERQALCKARPVYGSAEVCEKTMRSVHEAIIGSGWKPEYAEQIRHMRVRLQNTASEHNLKRGPGGTVDIEFLVQMLQLKHAGATPSVLVPGTLDAIQALREAGHLRDDDADYLSRSYRFLRSVEARLRLMNTTARHDVPTEDTEQEKLAFLLEYDNAESLIETGRQFTEENRRRFDRLFDEAS